MRKFLACTARVPMKCPALNGRWPKRSGRSRFPNFVPLVDHKLGQAISDGLRSICDNFAVAFLVAFADHRGPLMQQVQGTSFAQWQAEELARDWILYKLTVNHCQKLCYPTSCLARD